MTLNRLRRLAKAAVAGAWGASAPLAGISLAGALCLTPAAAKEPCVGVAPVQPTRGFAKLHVDFARDLRADAGRAMTLACSETVSAGSADERATAAVDLGAALVGASQEREAVEVLSRAIAAHENDTTVDPLVVAAMYYHRGNAYRMLRELPLAVVDVDTARRKQLAANRNRTELYAQTLIATASLLERRLKVDEAERALDEAESILRDIGSTRSRHAVDVLNERTMIAYGRQDLTGTAKYAEAAVTLLRSIGGADDAELLEPFATLTAIRSMVGDFAGAEAIALEALRIVDLHPTLGIDARLGIVQNLSANYNDEGRTAKALPFAVEGLRLSRQHYGPGAPAVFRAHLMLGTVYRELGRYGEALEQYDAAAEIDVQHPGTVAILQRLRYLLGRATLNINLGDVHAARDDLARVAGVLSDQPRIAYWRGWHARLVCKLDAIAKDWPAVEANCGRAQEYQQEVLQPTNSLIASTIAQRCRAQTVGGLPGDACDRLRQRLESRAALFPSLRSSAYVLLAMIESTNGRIDRADELRLLALSAAEQAGTPEPLWYAQDALASGLAEQGQRSLAIFFGKLAIASIERMRQSIGADRERYERGFLADKLAVYRHVADWLLDDGRPVEAIETLRLMKVEEMLDYTERATTTGRPSIGFSNREAALARAFDPVNSATDAVPMRPAEFARLVSRRDDAKITADETARLEQWTQVAERRQQRRVDALKQTFVEQREPPSASSSSSPTAERANGLRTTGTPTTGPFASDQADAYLFMVDHRLQLVFVRQGQVTRRTIEVEPAVLTRRIAQFLASMSSPAFVEPAEASDELYAWLGEPLDREARAHGVRRIRLWLDGALRYVPFAALWDGRHYLVERYELSYRLADPSAVAASDKTTGAGRSAPATTTIAGPLRTMLAFGVTRPFEGLAALPGVGDELCAIVDGPVTGLDGSECGRDGRARGTFTGAGFANAFFTEERLRSSVAAQASLARSRSLAMVHLGTHLSLRPGTIQKSWLLLGDGTRLSLAALQSIDFHAADLVTLSACQSGLAGASGDDGREIEGLPTLLHRSGAKTVISSLWRIDDRSTARLMRTFYGDLRSSRVTVAAALRSAQIALMRSDDRARASPYYWAAFVASSTGD